MSSFEESKSFPLFWSVAINVMWKGDAHWFTEFLAWILLGTQPEYGRDGLEISRKGKRAREEYSNFNIECSFGDGPGRKYDFNSVFFYDVHQSITAAC